MSIDSVRRDLGEDRGPAPGAIPHQRSAADAYRVSDDQLHRARLVVAKNSDDPEDLRQLLDMLGLISAQSGPAAARHPLRRRQVVTGGRSDERGGRTPGWGRRRTALCWCGSQRTAVAGGDSSGGPSPHRLAA